MPRRETWSTRGGFSREDSDDELGFEDHPWEWIYEVNNRNHHNEKSLKRKSDAISVEIPTSASTRIISGARMGTFSVRIGDAVFLKSPEAGKDWAGLICAFSNSNEDGRDEMCAHIMWFCSREELESTGMGTASRNGGKTRKSRILPDALANESYMTADFNMNPLTAINGRAIVMGYEEYQRKYPSGKCPKGKGAATRWAKTIICRRGVKQRNLKFTDVFEWKNLYNGPQDLLNLLDYVKEHTRGRRTKTEDPEYDHSQKEEMVIEEIEPTTPKKRRKISDGTAETPRSAVKSSTKLFTPTGKRIIIRKPLDITPLGTRTLASSKYNQDAGMALPYNAARTSLHVSAVPSSLPCRSNEFSTVYSHLHSAITDGSGTCIYVSGTPGTGKTATVREVVAALYEAVQADELDDFNFVEINGMKVTEPAQSYSLLWEALKGVRVSPANALTLLEHDFSAPNPRRIPCVVLMDELDQLVTRSQSVMYNFFNWPSLRHSRLIVLAVANTMDLPERTLSNKISSRLGLTRITFPGYSHQQLMEIIQSRLEGADGIVDPDAVQFAARKVAAVSGDARRALDICRRAVEIAEAQAQTHNTDINGSRGMDEAYSSVDLTPSKTKRGPKQQQDHTNSSKVTHGTTPRQQMRVTISTIKQAISEATSSPILQHLRSLPVSAKLFLAALLARSRRTGVPECILGDVLTEAKKIADGTANKAINDLIADVHIGTITEKESTRRALPRVTAMTTAATILAEAGIIALEARSRGERAGKVRLRIGDEEVKSALTGDNEVAGLGFNA